MQRRPAEAAVAPVDMDIKVVQVPHIITFIGLLVLAIVPPVLLHSDPIAGVYSIFAALILLFLLAYKDQRSSKTAILLAIVPCALMVGVVLTRPTMLEQSLLLYDTLLVLAVTYRLLFGFGSSTEPQKRNWRTYWMLFPACIIVGQLLGGAGYFLLKHHDQFAHTKLSIIIPSVCLFAITEELVLRGTLQHSATIEFSRWWAILLPTVTYTALSLLQGSMLVTAFAALSSLVLSILYALRPDLLLTATTNLTMKLLFVSLIAVFK